MLFNSRDAIVISTNHSTFSHCAIFLFPCSPYLPLPSAYLQAKSAFNFRSFAKTVASSGNNGPRQLLIIVAVFVLQLCRATGAVMGAVWKWGRGTGTGTGTWKAAIQLSVCKYVEKLIHCTSVHRCIDPRTPPPSPNYVHIVTVIGGTVAVCLPPVCIKDTAHLLPPTLPGTLHSFFSHCSFTFFIFALLLCVINLVRFAVQRH